MAWSESPTAQMLPLSPSQQPEQTVLSRIDVLILVDDDILVPFPVCLPEDFVLKQFDRDPDQIVEVQGVPRLKSGLVIFIVISFNIVLKPYRSENVLYPGNIPPTSAGWPLRSPSSGP